MSKAKKQPAREAITAGELQSTHDELLEELKTAAATYFMMPMKPGICEIQRAMVSRPEARCNAEALARQLAGLREMAKRVGFDRLITAGGSPNQTAS